MIRLRAHTLLCVQGFRGEGYSASFVQNFSRIYQDLAADPEQEVEILDGPDVVCQACPHLTRTGCEIDGDQSEEAMRDQDRRVLSLLGLTAGHHLPWSEVLDKIRGAIMGADLPGICGGCRWLPLGYCREGIDRLRTTHPTSS